MQTYVVRVWVPDRPGALGAVASRIGAVGGDVTGIDILERRSSRAIDELTVEMEDSSIVDLLVKEVTEVDGVEVEDVLAVDRPPTDARLDGLEAAAILVAASAVEELVDGLCANAARMVAARWGLIVDVDAEQVVTGWGAQPPDSIVDEVLDDSRGARDAAMSADVVCAPMPAGRLMVVLGCSRGAFRDRERRTIAALARIVDARLADLKATEARAWHPSSQMPSSPPSVETD